MRKLDMISTANSNLRRSKLRTFLTILAISIGTFTLALSLGLGQGVRNYITSQLGEYEDVNLYQVTKQGTDDFSGALGNGDPKEYDPNKASAIADFSQAYLKPADIKKIQSTPGVESIQLPYSPSFDYAQAPDGKKYTAPAGVFTPQIPTNITEGKNLEIGKDAGKIILSRKYTTLLGVDSSSAAIGKKIELTYKNIEGKSITELFEVKGIFEPTLVDMPITINDSDAKRIATAQAPLGNPTFFAIFASKSATVSDAEFKQNLKNAQFEASSLADINNALNSIVTGVQAALAAFSGIAILASVVGVINTLFMAVLERTREIGLFRALGAKKKTVFALFSIEAALLGFWGSIFGIGAAFLAQLAINSIASNTFLKGIEGIQLLNITPPLILIIVASMAGLTMIAGLIPALKASRLDPIEALRYE